MQDDLADDDLDGLGAGCRASRARDRAQARALVRSPTNDTELVAAGTGPGDPRAPNAWEDRREGASGRGSRARSRRPSSGRTTSSTSGRRASVGGHVLLEGVPGVAKTLLANAFARAHRCRVPARAVHARHAAVGPHRHDDAARRRARFRPGPVFTNLLLADEINRTPPKTQAALLEAMQERQVSVDGVGASAARAVPRRRDPEPDRVRRHVSRCPKPSSTASSPRSTSAIRTQADETAMLRLAHRGVAPATLDDVQSGRRRRRSSRGLRDSSTRRPSPTSGRLRRRRRAPHTRAAERCARRQPARRGASPRGGEGRGPAGRAARYVIPDDVAGGRTRRCCGIGIMLHPEAELERFRADDAIASVLRTVPVPR